MTEDQSLRQEWDRLLAAHRALVTAYLESLGTDIAPWVAQRLRATTVQVSALSAVLKLPLESQQQ